MLDAKLRSNFLTGVQRAWFDECANSIHYSTRNSNHLNVMYASTENYPIGRLVKCFNFTQDRPAGADTIAISYEDVISIDLPENYQEFNNPFTDESWEVISYSIERDAGKFSEVIFDLKTIQSVASSSQSFARVASAVQNCVTSAV